MNLFDFIFKPFAEPLFHHALIVEVAGAGNALDTGEHPGIEAQRDRGRLAVVGSMHRGIHETWI